MDNADRAQEGIEQNEDVKAKREREKREQAQKKKQAMSDYERLLVAVEDLKAMTDTQAFKDFTRRCQKAVEQAKTDLLSVEKPRDLAYHQSVVKVINAILEEFKEPVENLQKFVNDMPLFAGEMKTRAAWNGALNTVEIRTA